MTASKLYFLLKVDCQLRCDSIHAQMLATNPVYAADVKAGNTVRWAVPMQDIDPITKLAVDARWWIPIDERSAPVLSGIEVGALADIKGATE